MIVVLSPEQNYPNEALWANRLLEAGLQYFHIRKPHWDDTEVAKYIDEIDKSYHSNIVVHDRLEVAANYGLKRMHYSEKKRNNSVIEKMTGITYSSSVHSMSDFNELNKVWDYVFVSPIFPSISKLEYGLENAVFPYLQCRTNLCTKLIGLGGISSSNISKVKEAGADGVALLGYIWQSNNPLNAFISCKY